MIQRVLVGLDGSPASLRALDWAIRWSGQTEAELHSLSIEEIGNHAGAVLPMDDEKEWSESRYAGIIRRAQDLAAASGMALHPHVAIGHEVKALVQFCRDQQFDLLVIGRNGYSAMSDEHMGGTCFGLVQHAPCPVVVVR